MKIFADLIGGVSFCSGDGELNVKFGSVMAAVCKGGIYIGVIHQANLVNNNDVK